MGYSAESDSNAWSWEKKENKTVLSIVGGYCHYFFITSILFNSLKQPLIILFIITHFIYRCISHFLLVQIKL
jgi:multidrug efflux pump subunit AcrB